MSKRFAATCFIVLACVMILCFGFVLFLFLFPGTYILGLKYVAANTHGAENVVDRGKTDPVLISECPDYNNGNSRIGSFSGKIFNSK